MATTTESTQAPKRRFAVLVPDPDLGEAIPKSACFKTYRRPTEQLLEGWQKIFVLATLASLPSLADFLKKANQRHRLCAVLVDRGDDFDLLPQFLHHSQVRTLRNMLVHAGPVVPRRVLNAYCLGAEHELIADAQVVNDWLFLVSCASDAFEVPFDAIPALRTIPPGRRRDFHVSPDGAYIHWPVGDVHLDLDSIRRRTDPEWAARRKVEDLIANASVGEAIADLRQRAHLRQTDIPGLSERQVRRIEKGQDATLGALRSFAAAQNDDLGTYINQVAEAAQSQWTSSIGTRKERTVLPTNRKVTGKKAATKASKTLTGRKTTAKSKAAAGSALSQRKAPTKQTSKKAASAASKVLKDKRTSKTSKSAAGSALSQKPGRSKKGKTTK